MKRFLMPFLAVFFPWIILLIDDNPIGALIALALQVTLIGWIPVVIWAFHVLNKQRQLEKNAKKDSAGS